MMEKKKYFDKVSPRSDGQVELVKDQLDPLPRRNSDGVLAVVKVGRRGVGARVVGRLDDPTKGRHGGTRPAS